MKDKKGIILGIATRLFSERGFENTPLSSICEEANVSKGLIFHHFKSKNDLLREIFRKTTNTIIQINTTEQSSISPKAKLLELIDSFFIQLEKDKLFFQLNLSAIVQPKTRELLSDLVKERSSFILNSSKSIFDKIDSNNALILSYMFIAELDGIALNYLGIFEEYPLQKMKKHLLNKYTANEFYKI
ncbi:TetR/AcrR family transcriptional regulator [Aquimarina sediminis]|uniref:TetR/AcrR family transcriptional regulator n=1 Tax=Aquimarina sediminis TaxID=2070536 RepID=UPI000CA061CE|nr:TetR/AcrR family transcriptional regulator [Aquimarina sediminis]